MANEIPPPSSRSERTPPLPPATDSALLTSAGQAHSVREFRYTATGERTPGGRGLTRPALAVTLIDRQGEDLAVAHALIDTGADFTTLSTEWAGLLGIDLERDCERLSVSVVDEHPSTRHAYFEGMEIKILGDRLFLPVVMFCKGLPIAVLGRRDFFRRYLVLIDQRHSRFFLERLEDLDEDDDELDKALVAT